MTASLRALLEGIIDYAGLFPPAQLPLEEAFPNYLRYRQEAERWMLGRFVIPVGRLSDLAVLLKSMNNEEHPVSFSVLSQGKPTDWESVSNFCETADGRATVDVIEIRFENGADETEFVPRKLHPMGIFFEAPASSKEFARALREFNRVAQWYRSFSPVSPPPVGLKFRCGGLEATAFPPPNQVSLVITACLDVLAPLKFTAGLHHPIRHYRDEVKTKMHGFLNVFGAGVLAHRHRLSEEQVRAIIEDEDPTHFVFDDECFRWKDYRATVGEIRLARQLAVTSFGSCSFDEPREDLRKLGLL
jgi:hypothetical protein